MSAWKRPREPGRNRRRCFLPERADLLEIITGGRMDTELTKFVRGGG